MIIKVPVKAMNADTYRVYNGFMEFLDKEGKPVSVVNTDQAKANLRGLSQLITPVKGPRKKKQLEPKSIELE